MIRLSQAIFAVMAGTVAGGVSGGIVGAAVGRISPSFVAWLHSPEHPPAGPGFDATEFGFGLGVVSGLLLGAGTTLALAIALAVRDAWLAGTGPSPSAAKPAWD